MKNPTICIEDGCDKRPVARGRCDRHYRIARAATAPRCSVPGCENSVHGHGLCSAHIKAEQIRNAPPCSHLGCEKPSASCGMCRAHYSANRSAGLPVCSVTSCKNRSRKNGLCDRHLPNQRGECSIDGCRHQVASLGLCVGHYTRFRRYGTTGDPELNRSLGEQLVADALAFLGIQFTEQATGFGVYDSGQPMRFDFYLPEHSMLIEYDGLQHYRRSAIWHSTDDEWRSQLARDDAKSGAARENGVNLLRIRYGATLSSAIDAIRGSIAECANGAERFDCIER